MDKEYIPVTVEAVRVFSHNEIKNLANGFKLKREQPFSVMVVPVDSIDENGVISFPDTAGLLLDCKCLLDGNSSPMPVMFNQWTEAAVVEISPAAVDLGIYRVFWAAGVGVEES